MNKNLVIGIVVILIVVVGAFFVFRGTKMLDVSVWQGDETELTSWANDLEMFASDAMLANELDQTFGDLLDERTAVSAEAALEGSSLAQEESQVNFSQTLDTFAADDAVLQELNQIAGEVSQ